MIPLAENPAVIDPEKHLTLTEQAALTGIGRYRHQSRRAGYVVIGDRRFMTKIVDTLRDKGLINGKLPNIKPTGAGRMAIARLLGIRGAA